MSQYIIEVKGEIIANELTHYAQNWVCGACTLDQSTIDNYQYDRDSHSVHGNLILNSLKRAVPYAIYYTNKGIAATSSGDISASPGYIAAEQYYKNNIAFIQEQLCMAYTVCDKLLQTLYKGLFMDIFSILELFLSDVLLCMIYSNETIYKNALNYYKLNKCNNHLMVYDLEKKMHNFFFTEIIYHRFNTVNKLFLKIANINIPNYRKLEKYLHKRNNIVHRYSLSNIDRMRVTVITEKDVNDLIVVSNEFVKQLVYNIKSNENI